MSQVMSGSGRAAVLQYAVVTGAYWGFTLTDGALRMLVLLHFYQLGYSPFTLAFLFLLYEFAGVLANLIGGWLATRYGITRMLKIGLSLQIAGFLCLSALSPQWSVTLSVVWVVVSQGICGVAKDLTKTASKSAIKITARQAQGQLFRWVAWFTGSKNAMKGIGFFLGGFLLQILGFSGALWTMAAGLLVVLAGGVWQLPALIGTLLSGLLYQWGGLVVSLSGSAIMLCLCWLITLMLPVQPGPTPQAVTR